MRHLIRPSTLLLSAFGTLAACGGGGSSGSPASDAGTASQWVGKTYLLDTPAISPNAWTKPKGIGSELGTYVPQFLISVEAGAGDTLNVTLATATGGVQDLCNPTTQVTMSGATYPQSAIWAKSLPMRILNPNVDAGANTQAVVTATAHNFTLTNVLPGNSAATDGTLDSTVDIADLFSLFYVVANPTKDTICATLETLSVSCQTCAHNGQKYCLDLQAVQIGAAAVATPVKTVLASDIPTSCQ